MVIACDRGNQDSGRENAICKNIFARENFIGKGINNFPYDICLVRE